MKNVHWCSWYHMGHHQTEEVRDTSLLKWFFFPVSSGTKHKTMLEARNGSGTIKAFPRAGIKGKGPINKGNTGLQNKTFHCEICDVHVNSETQLKQVLNSKACIIWLNLLSRSSRIISMSQFLPTSWQPPTTRALGMYRATDRLRHVSESRWWEIMHPYVGLKLNFFKNVRLGSTALPWRRCSYM